MAENTRVSEQDLQSVAQKMVEWGKSLPQNEQAAFALIMQRAANRKGSGNGSDVQGFDYAVAVDRDAFGDVLWEVFTNAGYFEGYVWTDPWGNVLY